MSEASSGVSVPAAAGASASTGAGEQDPGKVPAGSAASAQAEPEFEYELEEAGPDGKAVKKAAKIKMSEAKQRLANLNKLEGSANQQQQRLQRYYEEHIRPLELQVEAMKRDPSLLHDFARRLGVDYDAAALKYAERQIELSKMTPEQRELNATKEENARLKAEQNKILQDRQQQEQQVQVRQAADKISDDIMREAKAAGLPNDPAVLMIMTGFLRAQVQKNLTPDAKAAAEYASRVVNGGFSTIAKGLTYERIEKEYPELLTIVREGDIKKVKGAARETGSPQPRPARSQSNRSPIMSAEDFQRKLERGE